MKLLCLDTSSQVASCALVENGRLVTEINLRHGLTHSAKLLPLMQAALDLAGWEFSDLTALAVVAGPGSFTGLRIGAATVKGLAFSLNLPVIPVGTLEALAQNACGYTGLIVPLLDARRGEVYAAAYRMQGDRLQEVMAPCAQALTDFLARMPEESAYAFVGDGVEPNRETLLAVQGAFLMPDSLRLQRAGAVADLAHQKYLAGETVSASDFLPDYLRESSAVPPQGLRLWDF